MWKIIFVECRLVGGHGGVHRDPNAIAVQRPARLFSDTCQKMRGGKHVKVKKRRRQDILRFRADARKLILGSIGTPLPWPLLSVNAVFKWYSGDGKYRINATNNNELISYKVLMLRERCIYGEKKR